MERKSQGNHHQALYQSGYWVALEWDLLIAMQWALLAHVRIMSASFLFGAAFCQESSLSGFAFWYLCHAGKQLPIVLIQFPLL